MDVKIKQVKYGVGGIHSVHGKETTYQRIQYLNVFHAAVHEDEKNEKSKTWQGCIVE